MSATNDCARLHGRNAATEYDVLYAAYLEAFHNLKNANAAMEAARAQFELAHAALVEYEERLEDLCR